MTKSQDIPGLIERPASDAELMQPTDAEREAGWRISLDFIAGVREGIVKETGYDATDEVIEAALLVGMSLPGAAAPKSEGAATGEPFAWSWTLHLPMGSFIEAEDGGVKPVRRTKQCLTTFKPDVSDPDVSDVRALYLAAANLPVAWVTADILAAMKRGEKVGLGWKYSADFCIPLFAGALPAAREEVRVTEAMVEAEPFNTGLGWENLSCDDQFTLARMIAANVGYVLVPEPSIQEAARQAPAAPSQEVVAWRWRWGKMGNIAWKLSTTEPTFPEDGYEKEALGVLASPQGQESGVID